MVGSSARVSESETAVAVLVVVGVIDAIAVGDAECGSKFFVEPAANDTGSSFLGWDLATTFGAVVGGVAAVIGAWCGLTGRSAPTGCVATIGF